MRGVQLMMSSPNAYMQLILSMALAILVGLLAEYFVTERTAEQARDAYLYSMGLTLAILLSAFVHNHGFLQAQEIGVFGVVLIFNYVCGQVGVFSNFMAFVTYQCAIVSVSYQIPV